MAKAEKKVPQVINFDGKQYDISKMTDRVAEQFNMLVRLQSEWQDASFNLKKVEAAQKTVVTELQVFMKEDNIKIDTIELDENGNPISKTRDCPD